MFTGDFLPHETILKDSWDEDRGEYDFFHLFSEAAEQLKEADLAVANLECTLGNPPYTGFPEFNAPEKLVEDARKAGIGFFSTANNHAWDRGKSGIVSTLDVLDSQGLLHTGTYRSKKERDAQHGVCVTKIGDITIAFLSYTFGINGHTISQKQKCMINLFNKDYEMYFDTPDIDLMKSDLDYAQSLKVDLIVVLMHWGNEDEAKPDDYQKELAKILVKNGADIVIGNHPHVLQRFENIRTKGCDGKIRKGFVCYSLGNFFSNQEDMDNRITVVLDLTLIRNKRTGKVSLKEVNYTPYYMYFMNNAPFVDPNVPWGNQRKLLNIHKHLSCPETKDEDLMAQLKKALNRCHEILGTVGDSEFRKGYEPATEIEFGYSRKVKRGTIRYISQLSDEEGFFKNYWPKEMFGTYTGPQTECGTACGSMALSFLGVNLTPKDMLEAYGGRTRWDAWDVVFCGWMVGEEPVLQIPDLISKYMNPDKKFSPVVIHFPKGSWSERGHYILLIGKKSDTEYIALDPASSKNTALIELEIHGLLASACNIKDGVFPIDRIHQWYIQ